MEGKEAELASSWIRVRRHGCVCVLESLEVGDEREQEGELMGKRRPRERREEEDGELRAKPPLFARGRAAACVGEEAVERGEGESECG